MDNKEYNIDKSEHFIKIAEAPKIKYEYSELKFDDKINELIKKIIDNNNSENNKLIYNNIKNITLRNKTFERKLYNLFISPIFGRDKIVMATYDIINNVVTFYEDNDLMIGHELIHMASSVTRKDRVFSGFCQIFQLKNRQFEVGRGLTEGYTSIEADRIFGHLNNSYYVEKDLAKKLEQIVGVDKLRHYFYNADLMGLVRELSKYDSLNNIIDVLLTIDRVCITRDIEEKKNYTKELYLKFYEYNQVKRKHEHDRGLLSDEEYERLTIDFSRYYLLDVMRMFNYEEIIKEEERTK